ncbi:LysE family transporter [Pseudomonas sp. 3MA1]|uniref:LysE family translocator n=1 Tax=Pseudomonas sp. 3MA1 TaxID=2699196 RepID=UPI0023DDB5F5|nr:LysE family transporter [Pseudomonas sp. 3MA1]MDF2399488.1 LysE family transporter [Pseudomonas sp. 3MA1]
MDLNLSLLLAYALSVLLLVATPGPVVALIINTSLNAGPRQALLTALGTHAASLLLALLALLAALMLTTGLALDPRLISGISLLGCGFIGWLALQGLREATGPQTAPAAAPTARGRRGLANGFLLGISNPKDILFFVSFFPQFIQVSRSVERSALLLTLVWVVIDFAVLGAYILMARQGFSLKYKRQVTGLSSLVLLAVALAGLVYTGFELYRSGAA